MKFIRIEKQYEPNGKVIVREIRELPWLSIIPVMSVILSTFTSLFAVYSIYKNNENQRDFELYKVSYNEKYKTIIELMESTSEIINYVGLNPKEEKIPENLINKFDQIYISKLSLFFDRNDSVILYCQEFKYQSLKWKNNKTHQDAPTDLKIINEKLIKCLQKELNTN